MKKHSLSFLVQGSNEEEDADKQSTHFALTQILIPLGVLFIGAIGLLAGSDKLPTWALSVVIIYLITVIGFSLTLPFKKLISFIQTRLKTRRLAKPFYSQLKHTAHEFSELMDGQHYNSILYVLKEMNGWEELRETQNNLDSVHWNKSWLESIQERLEEHQTADFNFVAKDLSIAISQHHYFCVRSQERLALILNKVSLQEHHSKYLREQWQLAREQHMRQVKNWEDLAKRINQVAGGYVCLEYYEPIKPF